MALSVTQSMNMSFLSSLLPKKEAPQTEGKQPATITNIVASMQDQFDRQRSGGLFGGGTVMYSAQGGQLLSFGISGSQQPLSGKMSGFVRADSGERLALLSVSEEEFQRSMLQTAGRNASSSSSATGGWSVDVSTGDSAPPSDQHAVNRRQAAEIKAQLNNATGADWGVDSLGEDLAVFGLDFTALNGNLDELKVSVRAKAQELVDDLDRRNSAGSVDDYDAKRRVISGAAARLMNGLEASDGRTAQITASAAAGVKVNVGGTSVDASAIVAVGSVIVDPLVLDLEGDGLDLKGMDGGVRFDMDGDGDKTAMGFIQGDDALLFVDSEGDGLVHDGRQLFGNTDGHANGFEKLRSYDDNADGVIDEQDAVFDQLRVWVEKNENGVSEDGETMSLAEAGVKSINVGYENTREDDGTGNLIGQTGTFTRDDNTTGLAADVWFQEGAE